MTGEAGGAGIYTVMAVDTIDAVLASRAHRALAGRHQCGRDEDRDVESFHMAIRMRGDFREGALRRRPEGRVRIRWSFLVAKGVGEPPRIT